MVGLPPADRSTVNIAINFASLLRGNKASTKDRAIVNIHTRRFIRYRESVAAEYDDFQSKC